MANKLYEGKLFYVIENDNTISGPYDNIRYVNAKKSAVKKITELFGKRDRDYAFIQVIDGKPVVGFTADEIVVVKNGKQVA